MGGRKCIVCGLPVTSERKTAKYCSRKCMGIGQRGRKLSHSKEHTEKRLAASKKARTEKGYSRGYKRPKAHTQPMLDALAKKIKENPEKYRENAIRNLSKNKSLDLSNENSPNWRGGITKDLIKERNKTKDKHEKWRQSVLKRDSYACKECGRTDHLHVHHIIARKTLPDAAFVRANGVTLCVDCHKKTDSFGGGKDSILYNRKGNILKYVMKVIPHKWQDYPTVGNYFHLKHGTIVIFCSDMKNDKYHQLIFAHEMFEVGLVIARKIPIRDIDKFDINFEKERENGLHGPDEEPGDNKKSPYHKEHVFATKMERAFAKAFGVDWEEYSKTVNSL